MDKIQLKEIITYLENKPNVESDEGFYYDKKIYELLNCLGIDENYQEHYDKLENKEISSLSCEDLKAYYTFILRGERFADGYIAAQIKDGTLLKLAKQHLNLIMNKH